MMSPGPTVWMVATSMAARPYASTGPASGPWSVRTSSLWAFIELRMARSSRKSGRPSAISKADRSRGRRTGLKIRRSDTFSVFERERWLASTSRMLPRGPDLFRARTPWLWQGRRLRGSFVVVGVDAAEVLEAAEGVLDEVAAAITFLVVADGVLATAPAGDDGN